MTLYHPPSRTFRIKIAIYLHLSLSVCECVCVWVCVRMGVCAYGCVCECTYLYLCPSSFSLSPSLSLSHSVCVCACLFLSPCSSLSVNLLLSKSVFRANVSIRLVLLSTVSLSSLYLCLYNTFLWHYLSVYVCLPLCVGNFQTASLIV